MQALLFQILKNSFCLSFGICLLEIPIRSLMSDEDCGVLKEPLHFGAETCENRLPFICMKNNKDNESTGQILSSRIIFLLLFLCLSTQSPFLSFQQSGRCISPHCVEMEIGLGGKDSVINSTVQQSRNCPIMKLGIRVRWINLILPACTVQKIQKCYTQTFTQVNTSHYTQLSTTC